MKKTLKILSLFLAVTLLFSSCQKGSGQKEDSTEREIPQSENTERQEQNGELRLPYNNADGINPFFAKSYENLYLARLLYFSLFSVTSSYEAEPLIADSISVSGKNSTVKIKSGLVCRGSTAITPADVVYSFNKAKTSYAYGESLKSIESAAVSGNSVVFTSAFADSRTALKLTFPIVKENTAELQTDIPIGFGKYYFYENTLVSIKGDAPTVLLTSVNKEDTSLNAYKIGNTDIFFSDLADCSYTQLHGNFVSADLNNMVYLGFNEAMGGLSKNIRSAVAVILNSQDIAQECYQGHAIPCKMPCNPNSALYKANNANQPALDGDVQKGADIIDRCAFTRYAGKALTNGAFTLSFSLIVNADNKYRVAAAYAVADALNNSGFYIEVTPLSFEDYSERISSGNYNMYIGETKLDFSMDLSQFFTEDGSLSKGLAQEKTAQSYFDMRSGKISYEDFYRVFVEYHPFVPLVFRTGAVFSTDNFNGDFSHFPYDLLEVNYELFS